MADKPVPLTREGKAKLEEQLEGLRVQRRTVAARIHNAQEQGTSQNDAEYDDAKLEQGMVEGRILETEEAADDHGPVGPRAAARHDQPVPPRLNRPAVAAVGGDPSVEVGGVALERAAFQLTE